MNRRFLPQALEELVLLIGLKQLGLRRIYLFEGDAVGVHAKMAGDIGKGIFPVDRAKGGRFAHGGS